MRLQMRDKSSQGYANVVEGLAVLSANTTLAQPTRFQISIRHGTCSKHSFRGDSLPSSSPRRTHRSVSNGRTQFAHDRVLHLLICGLTLATASSCFAIAKSTWFVGYPASCVPVSSESLTDEKKSEEVRHFQGLSNCVAELYSCATVLVHLSLETGQSFSRSLRLERAHPWHVRPRFLIQLCRYLRSYSEDSLEIKSIVAAVTFLQTVHVVIVIHICYYYLVAGYGEANEHREVWSLCTVPLASALIALTSQFFFARRVSIIGRRFRVLVGIVILLLIIHVAVALGIVVECLRVRSLSVLNSRWGWLLPTGLGCATAADLLLSSAILYALNRSAASEYSCNSVWDILVVHVVNTGLLTGIMNALPTFMAIAYPQTYIWGAVNFVGSRVYLLTLLNVLNSRKFMASRGIRFFESERTQRNVFARRDQLATLEEWNVPQIGDELPPVIHITIEAEVEARRDPEGQYTTKSKSRRHANSERG
ncbi:hypothetical protein BD413DRAFT_583618 [Trametes elegans]|nr:hypothetical protein BD413DRAFT_583618 [Trametes elegans]